MTTKLYKAGEVCELLQVQPYVLRSWEKEFPGIGVQKGPESPRVYRQSDVDHVQRIKQLVFGEGLTVSGARRRLEESAPLVSAVTETEAADVMEALGDDVRSRIAVVREGLRQLQSMLSNAPGASNGRHASKAASAPSSRRTKVTLKSLSGKSSRGKARASSARSSSARTNSARNSAPRKSAKRVAAKASPARKKTALKRKHARA